jgi:hypothetical protein
MTDTTNESAPLLIYPRPTPSTPGAPVEGRDEEQSRLAQWRLLAEQNGNVAADALRQRDALAAEVRRLREALADIAQRAVSVSLDRPDLMANALGFAYGRASGELDPAARSPREDATTSTTEG